MAQWLQQFILHDELRLAVSSVFFKVEKLTGRQDYLVTNFYIRTCTCTYSRHWSLKSFIRSKSHNYAQYALRTTMQFTYIPNSPCAVSQLSGALSWMLESCFSVFLAEVSTSVCT